MGWLSSKAMPAWVPLPMRPRTKFSRMSSHPQDAAIAQDARFKIHSNAERGIISGAFRITPRETRCDNIVFFCEGFEFAITGMLLPRAGTGMVRHQHLDEGAPCFTNFVRGSVHYHARFNRAHAGGREYARADIHHADTADAHGCFVLLMAQGGDGDVVHPGGIEYRGSRGDGNFFAVDRGIRLGPAHACLKAAWESAGDGKLLKQAPEGLWRRDMCASISSRKCFSTDEIGAGTTCPRPQMEVNRRVSESSSIRAKSPAEPSPRAHPARRSTTTAILRDTERIFRNDSLRKNCVALREPPSSMQVPSAQTTRAPEPSIEPASASALKSSRTSAMDAGR